MNTDNELSPTPYRDVNLVLRTLLENVRVILVDSFLGMYLYGSLSGGDFDPGRSDIDFLVVTQQELAENVVAALETMHARIGASGLEWASKLEGIYIPRSSMWEYDPVGPLCPMINEGNFSLARPGMDWVINRRILYEGGVAVSGPPLKEMIRPVEAFEIRGAVISLLRNNWASLLHKPDFLLHPGYQCFAVLTMCRALYSLEHGTVASKTISAEWAIATLDKKWAGLIKQAIAWHYGEASGNINQTQEFMRYALKLAGAG